MPILNMRVQAGQQASPAALVDTGPIMQATLTHVTEQTPNSINAKSGWVSQISGYVVIDTGANRTAIDADAAKELKLPIMGRVAIASASQPDVIAPVYAAKLAIPGFIDINVPEGLVGVNLQGWKNRDIIGLIGRDLLAAAVLVYNGPEGAVTLSI